MAHDNKTREGDKENTAFHAEVTAVTEVSTAELEIFVDTEREVDDLGKRFSPAKRAVATSKTSSAGSVP